MTADLPAPSIDSSLRLKLLPAVLSMIAGSADVISFLGLGRLFVAHITGNLVILAAHIVTGTRFGIAHILAVPVFILVLGLVRVLAAGLKAVGIASLQPFLVLQFVLLAGFLALSISAGPRIDPDGLNGVLAGMLAVSAMAVQNALVQISVRGAPSTAVMTTNITRFMMDSGEVLLGRDPGEVAAARRRAAHTWPAIVGFAAGAAAGAALFMVTGPRSVALPTGLALLALASARRRL